MNDATETTGTTNTTTLSLIAQTVPLVGTAGSGAACLSLFPVLNREGSLHDSEANNVESDLLEFIQTGVWSQVYLNASDAEDREAYIAERNAIFAGLRAYIDQEMPRCAGRLDFPIGEQVTPRGSEIDTFRLNTVESDLIEFIRTGEWPQTCWDDYAFWQRVKSADVAQVEADHKAYLEERDATLLRLRTLFPDLTSVPPVEGQTHAEQILTLLTSLIAKIDQADRINVVDLSIHILELYELPQLSNAAQTQEAAAGFASALFGSDVVPLTTDEKADWREMRKVDPNHDENLGGWCANGFRALSAILRGPEPARALLVALGTVAHQMYGNSTKETAQ